MACPYDKALLAYIQQIEANLAEAQAHAKAYMRRAQDEVTDIGWTYAVVAAALEGADVQS